MAAMFISKFVTAVSIICAASGAFASQPLPLADPYIYPEDGTYYIYGTKSPDGIEVYASSDLEHWDYRGLALDKKNSYADRWFWAPEVYHVNGRYYMFYSADEHICVASSSSPTGPFVQDEKKPLLPDKNIDSSLFIDDNGTPYIFFVRLINGNSIWAAEMTPDLKNIKLDTLSPCVAAEEPWERQLHNVAEGPSVIKHNGVYYLLYSANDFRSQDYGVGYATAASPLGPWTKHTGNPVLQRADNLMGTGHGAPFMTFDGKYKYVYHAHNNDAKVAPRLTHIKDMSISANGEISIINTPTHCVATDKR